MSTEPLREFAFPLERTDRKAYGILCPFAGGPIHEILAVSGASTIWRVQRYGRWIGLLFADPPGPNPEPVTVVVSAAGPATPKTPQPLCDKYVSPPRPPGAREDDFLPSVSPTAKRLDRLLAHLAIHSVRAAEQVDPGGVETYRAAGFFWELDARTACPLYQRFWGSFDWRNVRQAAWQTALNHTFQVISARLKQRWERADLDCAIRQPEKVVLVANRILRIVHDWFGTDSESFAVAANRFASGAMAIRKTPAAALEDNFTTDGGPDGPIYPMLAEFALLVSEMVTAGVGDFSECETDPTLWHDVAAGFIGSLDHYRQAYGGSQPQSPAAYRARHRHPPAATNPVGTLQLPRGNLPDAMHDALRSLFSEAPDSEEATRGCP